MARRRAGVKGAIVSPPRLSYQAFAGRGRAVSNIVETGSNRTAAARWPRWLAGIAFALLAALIGLISYRVIELNREQAAAAMWENHTYEVIAVTERTKADLFDMQRSGRGYLLVRDPLFLTPYRFAKARLPAGLADLRRLTADNPSQAPQVARIGEATTRLTGFLEAAFDVRSTPVRTPEQSTAVRIEGERLTALARRDFDAIVMEEQRLLKIRKQRVATLQSEFRRTLVALIGVGGLLLAVAVGAGFAALRGTAAARQAAIDAEVLKRSRDALEAAVASRTREIAAANAELQDQIVRARTAEAQVRQMQKLESVGQLTGGIAHDFNNMLAIIIGSLDLVLRRLDDPDGRVRKYVDNAMDGAKRAASLTARLLAFSRQQALAPEPIDANVFVGNISELLRRTLGEGVQIETVLAGGLWRAYADASELENAVLNLAVNARDAMDGAGKLTIETANTHLDDTYAADNADVSPGQYVVVCVTDTGGGMPKSVIEKAFDPFFTTKGVGKGTGLGLSQVFGFVKQSGGHVKIYSEEGQGTTVKLYLPRWTGADAPGRVEVATGEMPRARDNEVVLVVEDEDRVRLITVDTLRELGYVVLHASNGQTALDVLGQQPRVDLLFTDIVMPGMTGRELADAARTEYPELKVLYTTGYTKNAVVHNGMLDANVAFLPKPFTVAALGLKVRQVLDGGGINRTV